MKTAATRHNILVDDAQGSEIDMLRIAVIAKGESVATVEPVDPGPAAFGGFANGQHGFTVPENNVVLPYISIVSRRPFLSLPGLSGQPIFF
jgi:hypothetical protein